MSKPKLPSYRLHKSTGQAVVTLGKKDYYCGKFGTDESIAEYEQLLARWLMRNYKPAPPVEVETEQQEQQPENITVADAAKRYREHVASCRSKVEQAHVKGMLKAVEKLYSHKRTANIGPAQLRRIRRLMLSQNWCQNYVNQQIGRVKLWFNWLAEESLIENSTYLDLTTVKSLKEGVFGVREKDPISPVADDVVDATLPELGDTVADMVRLQLLTGMRPAELCIIRPCDIDRSEAEWVYTPRMHAQE